VSRIVVDASAIVALLLREPKYDLFEEIMLDSDPVISAATRIEVGCVLFRRAGTAGLKRLDRLLGRFRVSIAAVDERQSEISLEALERVGRGRRAEPAVLNYGDLFAYALAKSWDLPLLYKGNDFAKTDIRSALDAQP